VTQRFYATQLIFTARVGALLMYNIISTRNILPWLSQLPGRGFQVTFVRRQSVDAVTDPLHQDMIQCANMVARRLSGGVRPANVTSLARMASCNAVE